MFLYLNKLESPSPKAALCKVWLKLARWIWRKKFTFHKCIFAFFSPCKRAWPYISKNACDKFVAIDLVVLEKKMKMWKVYRQTDGRTDDGRQAIRKFRWSFSLDELKRHDKTAFVKSNCYNAFIITTCITKYW